jgi:hypothetical protein
MTEEVCAICLQPFSPADWDDRHTASDGEDVHSWCCDVWPCNSDQLPRENFDGSDLE